MFSGVIVRCILAASTLEGGRNTAKAVMAAVAAHRAEFEFEHHASGPNLDATPNDIIARLEGYSGVQLAEAFAQPELEHIIKWHCKYARQNGIHVSPTFMVDGLVQPAMGSGDAMERWLSQLQLDCKALHRSLLENLLAPATQPITATVTPSMPRLTGSSSNRAANARPKNGCSS